MGMPLRIITRLRVIRLVLPEAREGRASLRSGPGIARRARRLLPRLLPHTVQLCIRCRENPAGFWVSSTGGRTARRPWCLSCCETLDRTRCDVRAFQP
jgi:hypothetical protein